MGFECFIHKTQDKDLKLIQMEGLKKGITISVLAMQFVLPVLVLAQMDPANPVQGSPVQGISDVVEIIKTITRWLLVFLVVLAVVFIIMAAFKYITASGDAEKVKSANKQILYAVIAVVVGLLAQAVPPIVASIIGGSTSGNEQTQ